MNKFKVGDKVRIVRVVGADTTFYQQYIGREVVIDGFNGVFGYPYVIRLTSDSGDTMSHWCDKELELVTEEGETTMSNIVKKIKDLTLSADDKALRKTGLVDDCGNLTDDGKDVVWSYLQDEYDAKKVLAAEKKSKKEC